MVNLRRFIQSSGRMLSLMAVLLGCLIQGCRTTDDGRDDLSMAADNPWYDADGNASECAATPKACPSFDDNKEFVDKCVATGFQAKTCGCGIRCSGKVAMPERKKQLAAAAGNQPACPEAQMRFIDQILKSSRQSFEGYKCATSHICSGHTVHCKASVKDSSAKVRQYAGQHCRAEVLERFCPDQFVDSLACPEGRIAQLSAGWLDVFKKSSVQVKQCYQNVLCNSTSAKCSPGLLLKAKELQEAVEADGCEYWLQNFCSVGSISL